jgi:hypothetical protein
MPATRYPVTVASPTAGWHMITDSKDYRYGEEEEEEEEDFI